MTIKQRFEKAWWVLRHEGVVAFGKKLVGFLAWLRRGAHIRLNPYLPPYLRSHGTWSNEEYRFLSNSIFQITSSDIEASQAIQNAPKSKEVTTALWFVPYFNHLAFGGIYTIFRFIEGFATKGVHNTIVIYDNKYVDKAAMKEEILRSFPKLADAELIIFNPDAMSIEDLPSSDIAVCTFWVSAYFLLKYNKTKRKYYFIQDYEPLFYAGGSTYALAESTYRFGFKGIVNTPGLLRAVNMRHGLEGVSFVPAVDDRYFYTDEKTEPRTKIRIFFYARPNNPRNAFELGILIIQNLIKRYGDRIEVITAGAEWNEAHYELKGCITNLGLLKSLEEVGELYRSCDIGFVYMLSKHPSYQPFEFMASSMATVTNRNEDNLWFLKDSENCLIAEPSAAAMAEKIGWLIDDPKLLERIKEGGRKSVDSKWDERVDLIWNDVLKSKNGRN